MGAEQPMIYFDMSIDNFFIMCDDPTDLLTSLQVGSGLALAVIRSRRRRFKSSLSLDSVIIT